MGDKNTLSSLLQSRSAYVGQNTLSSLLQSRSAYGGQKHLELSIGEEI